MSSKTMSSVTEDVTLPLKVAINKQNTKVLSAEVDSELADVLISFLTLPMGRILRLFQMHYADEAPIIRSLNNLHKSLTNLNDIHFSTKEGKQMLLNPRNLFSDQCRKLKLNLDKSHPIKYFACENIGYWRSTSECEYRRLEIYGRNKCDCGKVMNKEFILEESESNSVKADSSTPRGVFTMKMMDFSVSDNLQIVPNGVAFLVQNLHGFGIMDTDGMRLTTVPIGLNEAMHLLKGLLVSQTVLTDLAINTRLKDSFTSKCEAGSSVDNKNLGKLETMGTKKLVNVKAVLQKSTNKLLFVQAKEDFVDFLFSLLTIPLGGIANLLGGDTSFVSLDTLYGSILNLDWDSLVMVGDRKDFIWKLRHCYLSPKNILPYKNDGIIRFSFDPYKKVLRNGTNTNDCFIDGRTNGCNLRTPGMFLVTDDLTVTPSTMFSAMSHLNMLKIPALDVEEVEIDIGSEEALKILKASLTSTSVITDTLMPLLNKRPK